MQRCLSFDLADPDAVLALPNRQARWPTPELSGKLFLVFEQPEELTWQQSSSSPADLPAFYAAIVEALGCSCQPAPG
jgi:hypothetical protein